MSISIQGRIKINFSIKYTSGFCSFSKMPSSNNLSITIVSLSGRINFTFSSVLWKRSIGFRVMAWKAWMMWIDSWVHKAYHNILSCSIKATTCRPYSSRKPQKLWGMSRKFSDLPVSLNRFYTRCSFKNFCLLILWWCKQQKERRLSNIK